MPASDPARLDPARLGPARLDPDELGPTGAEANRPRLISLAATALTPLPIKRAEVPIFVAAIAASRLGIRSIKAPALSEGPSLRRNPRMIPMVFSATDRSMLAFAASSPINATILPRLNRLPTGPRLQGNHLDLARCEIQAITQAQSAIHPQSRRECCSVARVDEGFCRIRDPRNAHCIRDPIQST